MKQKYIGGFFEMALPNGATHQSVLSVWDPSDKAIGFSNARSALAALLQELKPQRIFLPAFICQSVVDACQDKGEMLYYGIDEHLQPDTDFLNKTVQKNDVVLGINYFGRALHKEFLDFVSNHPDAIFIEDCAQALQTGQKAWGDWQLYSPRKILGVADGGYIIPQKNNTAQIPALVENIETVLPRWQAAFLRFEDKEMNHNKEWHQANQQREQSMSIDVVRISTLSQELLSRLDLDDIGKKRRENYQILHNNLSSIAFFKDIDPACAPFGFPVRLPYEKRNDLFQKLIKTGIFPAIHWPDLPSPQDTFPIAHQLSREMLTLPCDQRYDAEDMKRIVDAVKNALGHAV